MENARWNRGFKKTGSQAIGKPRGGWTTKIHMVAASAECALIFRLSPGNAGDAPQGRRLMLKLDPATEECSLLMDRAYEGNETQALSRSLGYAPVVPPNPNRLEPWDYDKELYKKRNEIERLFRRIKGYRRICTRYDEVGRQIRTPC